MTSLGTPSISEQIHQQFLGCAGEGSGGWEQGVTWTDGQGFPAQTLSGWKVGFLTKPN